MINYTNTKINKKKIYKENRYKSGIYKWNNSITGESYVGSSQNLTNRFYYYFSKCTIKKSSSYICKAILNYSHANFNLIILEYCEPNLLSSKEQYYIDLLDPKYNIKKKCGRRSKYK